VKAFYAQNQERFTTPEKMQTSHILITVAKAATAGEKKVARQKADSLLSRVRAGDEFEGLARENSGCPSAGKGGDLGFFGKGEMVPAFEQVAFGLEPGQLSDVVATDFGFHILKGGQRQPATAKSFEEIKTSLRQRLEQEAVLNAVRVIVGKQREEAKVEVLLKEE
jgi:peptidyl-prolyl cis-trans isomerase C